MTTGPRIRLGIGTMLLGSFVTIALFAIAAAILVTGWQSRNDPTAQADARLEFQEGPWGKIDALRMPLLNPDGALPDEAERMADPKWAFENVTEDRLVAFIRSCDLLPQQARKLLNKAEWTVTTNGFILSPPLAVVWSLKTETRARIYSVLAKNSANYPQHAAFRFPARTFEECLAASGISGHSIDRLKQLAYTNGASVCLADLQIAKHLLPQKDFDCLVAALYQFPAYRVRLVVNSKSDVNALVKYWGAGGRTKMVKPLLTSLAHVPGGVNMNLACVLPAFARVRLYSYPDAFKNSDMVTEDCFYTALNFFSDRPNTNLATPEFAQQVLTTECEPVQGNPTYGDLLLLLNEEGRPIHASVYIAGDFVFTKNGINPSQPWVLMKTRDMVQSYFGPNGTARVAMLRRRERVIEN